MVCSFVWVLVDIAGSGGRDRAAAEARGRLRGQARWHAERRLLGSQEQWQRRLHVSEPKRYQGQNEDDQEINERATGAYPVTPSLASSIVGVFSPETRNFKCLHVAVSCPDVYCPLSWAFLIQYDSHTNNNRQQRQAAQTSSQSTEIKI